MEPQNSGDKFGKIAIVIGGLVLVGALVVIGIEMWPKAKPVSPVVTQNTTMVLPTATPTTETEASVDDTSNDANPFDPGTTYENPFGETTNPFTP